MKYSRFWLLGLMLPGLVAAGTSWKPYPAELPKFDFSGEALEANWPTLTRSTRDTFPNQETLSRTIADNPDYAAFLLARFQSQNTGPAACQMKLDEACIRALSSDLQDAWRANYEGRFGDAHKKALATGTPEGKYLAYRVQTVYAMYMTEPAASGNEADAERTKLLKEAADQLKEEITALEDSGIRPSPQLYFWQAYANARYTEIMKPAWSWKPFTKKAQVTAILDGIQKVQAQNSNIPAAHALSGGTYAAIFQDGTLGQRTFRSRLLNCDGSKTTDFAAASASQFECALELLGNPPFPEVYSSYAKALSELDAEKNQTTSVTYKQYATGAQLPPGVSGMVFSSEDALARWSANGKKL